MKSLFVSHGSPMMVLDDTAASRFLRTLGQNMVRPSVVLAVSAHWLAKTPMVGGSSAPQTIHDFYGFPQELFDIRYPAPGDAALADRIAAVIGGTVAADQGLDHGIWSVASLMWPQADIPIIPISIQPQGGPRAAYEMGIALRSCLGDGGIVLASGSATHNLRAYMGQSVDTPPDPRMQGFADWLSAAVVDGRTQDLLNYRQLAPHAQWNHPTDEHLLPLYAAMGAGGNGTVLHRSANYGVISMDAYGF